MAIEVKVGSMGVTLESDRKSDIVSYLNKVKIPFKPGEIKRNNFTGRFKYLAVGATQKVSQFNKKK